MVVFYIWLNSSSKLYLSGSCYTIDSMRVRIKSVFFLSRGLDIHQETQILLWIHDYNYKFVISLLTLSMTSFLLDFDDLFYLSKILGSLLFSFLVNNKWNWTALYWSSRHLRQTPLIAFIYSLSRSFFFFRSHDFYYSHRNLLQHYK